ncbi:Phosphorylated carbohydrates phosphatase [Paenibacillus plantiphilus]|uniref:Phosphorylated carbohydrates phosphatase n=1 Tax=Paenibacillus plantiphilus TaxID=2905650 RepID=A0ABN8G9K3_9BACL|nr:Phosphorylated carbohydrates phosphatase [Paenibacillus plantiphilus]
MIKAVIFDFDGLIIDTETAWYQAFEDVFRDNDVEFPLEVFVKCIGTDDTLLNQFIAENIGIENMEIIKSLANENHKTKMETIVIRDGVKDYLTLAKALGLKIGLASSSSRQWVEGYLKELQIIDYFQVIKTRDDVANIKPDPALYLTALQALNVSANEAIAFEDSANGATAAALAGIKCVIVPNEVTRNIEFGHYDLRIESMSDMSLQQVISYLERAPLLN